MAQHFEPVEHRTAMKTANSIGATIFEPTLNHLPRKTWRQWLIGRPLQTAGRSFG